MGKHLVLSCALLLSGTLLSQQPVPMGKSSDSTRNYLSADGSTLTKDSSGEELMRALDGSYSNDPAFNHVQVAVKKHNVTLNGTVPDRDARKRAEKIATGTEGVRYVRNNLKIDRSDQPQKASAGDPR